MNIVGIIFIIGFILGALFSSSGLLSYSAGIATGTMLVKIYSNEHQPEDWVELDDLENGNNPVKKGINMIHDVKEYIYKHFYLYINGTKT